MTNPSLVEACSGLEEILLCGQRQHHQMGVWDVLRDEKLSAADGSMTGLHRAVHSGQIVPDEEIAVRGAVFRYLGMFGG